MTQERLNSAYYFPHDLGASNDPKLIFLRRHFGWKSIGMFWALIEAMHKEEDGWLEAAHMEAMVDEFYGQENGVAPEEVEQFKDTLHDSGLFITKDVGEGDDTTVYVSTRRVQENLEIRRAKSTKARQSVEKRWRLEKRKTKDIRTNSERSTIVHTNVIQGKGKEKEKESKSIDVIQETMLVDVEGEVVGEGVVAPLRSATKTPGEDAREFFATESVREQEIQRLIAKGGEEQFIRRCVKEFCRYWTELEKSGKRHLWEKRETFEVRKRLATWINRQSSPRSS